MCGCVHYVGVCIHVCACLHVASFQAPPPFTSRREPGNIRNQNHCKLPPEKVRHLHHLCTWQNVTLASDAPWTELNRAMNVQVSVVSVARLETTITRERYSLIWDGNAALLKGLSKLSRVEVSYKQVRFTITWTASY